LGEDGTLLISTPSGKNGCVSLLNHGIIILLAEGEKCGGLHDCVALTSEEENVDHTLLEFGLSFLGIGTLNVRDLLLEEGMVVLTSG